MPCRRRDSSDRAFQGAMARPMPPGTARSGGPQPSSCGWKKEPRNLGTEEAAPSIHPSPGMLPLALMGSSFPGFLIKSDTLSPDRLYSMPAESSPLARIPTSHCIRTGRTKTTKARSHEGAPRDPMGARRAGSSLPILRAFLPSWSLFGMTRAAACARLVAAAEHAASPNAFHAAGGRLCGFPSWRPWSRGARTACRSCRCEPLDQSPFPATGLARP